MKKADISAGVVYGMVPRWKRMPVPVVFLQDGPAAELFTHRGGRLSRAGVQDGRPSRGAHGGDMRGFAAVTGDRPEDVEGLDCAAELARVLAGEPSPSREGLRWSLVMSLPSVTGPWAEAIASYHAEEARIKEEGARANAEHTALTSRLDRVGAALAQIGITPSRLSPGGGGTVEIPVAEAERLIALACGNLGGPAQDGAAAAGLAFPRDPAVARPAGQAARHTAPERPTAPGRGTAC